MLGCLEHVHVRTQYWTLRTKQLHFKETHVSEVMVVLRSQSNFLGNWGDDFNPSHEFQNRPSRETSNGHNFQTISMSIKWATHTSDLYYWICPISWISVLLSQTQGMVEWGHSIIAQELTMAPSSLPCFLSACGSDHQEVWNWDWLYGKLSLSPSDGGIRQLRRSRYNLTLNIKCRCGYRKVHLFSGEGPGFRLVSALLDLVPSPFV